VSDDATGRKLRLRSLQDAKIVPTRYLWTDYLPVAELAMLVGKPGVGKSTVAADVAAKLTTGNLPGSFLGRPQQVLYSLTEDSGGTFKARFIAAGGDPDRLHVIDVVHGQSDGSPLLVAADLDQLRAAIIELRPALVVLDALNSSLDGQQNDNSNIRPQLEKLKALAHQTNTAILSIGHFRKSTTGSEPLDSIGGAGAYGQVIRQALGCARDEDEGTCTLSVIKTNGQSLDVASLAYRIEEAIVPSDDGGTASVGRVTWLGESDTTVRDLLQRSPQGDADRSEREEAADWLLDYLVSSGGEAPAKDVFKAGQAEGYSRDALKRAKGKRVRSEKAGFGSGWVWRLDPSTHEGSTKSAKGAGPEIPLPSLPSPEPALEPARQLHSACADHPDDKRAPNGCCVGCIEDAGKAAS
jgi:AAA domain